MSTQKLDFVKLLDSYYMKLMDLKVIIEDYNTPDDVRDIAVRLYEASSLIIFEWLKLGEKYTKPNPPKA